LGVASKHLRGADLVLNWTSLGGALEAVLRYLREPVSTAWVMGVSGLAFRLALPVAYGEVAVPDAESAIDLDRAGALIAGLGRKVETIRTPAGDRDFARRRDHAIRRIQRCIDHGIPAIVYGLHLPQFGLVKGYDTHAGTWQVSTVMSAQYGETMPLSRWPVPEHPGPLLAVLLDGRARVSPRGAVLGALRFAVDYGHRGDPGDRSDAAHGLAAYDRWRAAFTAAEPVSASGNAALVQMLQSARRDAGVFLRGEAPRLLLEAAEPLARAAAAYDAEALVLSRLVTMFPFPSGGDPSGPAARVVAAGALRDARALEEEAIDLLRIAVERAE
jgi:hypothetical protein